MTNEMPDEIWANTFPINTYSLVEHNKQDRAYSKPRTKYIRADLAQSTPAPCSAADSSGINASLNEQAEPADALERGTNCRLCNGEGEWYGNDGQAGPFRCDPCPAPMPEVDERGWVIVSSGRKAPVTPEQAAAIIDRMERVVLSCASFLIKPAGNPEYSENEAARLVNDFATIRALLKHAAGV